jgi:hypothetical protein
MSTRDTTLRAAPGLLMLVLLAIAPASAPAGFQPAFFDANPTKNSQDWTAAVASINGQINSDVNFQAMPLGTINGTFFATGAHSDGVTLAASDGSFGQVLAGPGPDQVGINNPVSPGEGSSSFSQYLQSTSPGLGGASSLTISFAAPVLAVGLYTIDYYGSDPKMINPSTRTNTLTFFVYSGPNGTGTLLGSDTASRYDFQPDGVYFMGYVAATDVIGSIVFSRGPDTDGDTIGIGGALFAVNPGISTVPEPSSLVLLGLGAAVGLGAALRRRRRAA